MIFFACSVALYAQDSADMPTRTPEQEALRQTEKLKQELDLTPEQTKKVYEINLRYAIQRQNSNSRSEAMERIKNKDTDIKKVLSTEQYDKLQNKHYERSTYKIPSEYDRSVRQTEQSSHRENRSEASNTNLPAVRENLQYDAARSQEAATPYSERSSPAPGYNHERSDARETNSRSVTEPENNGNTPATSSQRTESTRPDTPASGRPTPSTSGSNRNSPDNSSRGQSNPSRQYNSGSPRQQNASPSRQQNTGTPSARPSGASPMQGSRQSSGNSSQPPSGSRR